MLATLHPGCFVLLHYRRNMHLIGCGVVAIRQLAHRICNDEHEAALAANLIADVGVELA